MNASTITNRVDYLDAVRAFALLLGIVFHASLSFVPVYIGWAVMDISTSAVVQDFMLVSHSFRMELFFLIAGFFSRMTFHKKGAKVFLNSRILRIAIPFVVGWFILRPLIVSGWIMGGESMRGEVHIVNGLIGGFQSLGQLPQDLLTGSHLWFLYYLLMITVITLSVRALIGLNAHISSMMAKGSDRAVAWIAHANCSWIVLSAPTAACLMKMNNWGMDTPDKSLVPHLPVLIVYGGFFILGWLLQRQDGLIEQFGRITPGRIALALVSVTLSIGLSAYQTDMGHPHIGLLRGVFAFSYALMMWSLVALSLGICKRLFSRSNKVVRYIADASYWLYLIHLPVVIWLQIAFAELSFHWLLKLLSISLLTVLLSLLFYDLFVRSTVIGKVLNGRKKERMLFNVGTDTDVSGLSQPEFKK